MDYRHPSPAEREAALDLIAEAFGNARARQPEVRAAVLSDPDYGSATTLVAVDGASLVGHLATKRSALSLGGTWLPVARLGSVCSAPSHRRQGIGHRLATMAAELHPEVAAIVLNPASEPYVRTFYDSLGYRAARRTFDRWRASAALLPPGPAALVRAAREGEEPVLDALYSAHYGAQVGAKQRSLGWWARRVAGVPLLWTEMTPRVVVAEVEGRVAAYAMVTDDDDHRVWELAGERGAAQALLWHEAGRRTGDFCLAVNVRDPLWPVVAEGRPIDLSPPPGVLMVKVQSVSTLVAALTPLLAHRGADLAGDALTAKVSCGDWALTCDWTELLCLVYDGSILEERVRLGDVCLASGSVADWQRILPARPAGRRMTDAF